MVSTSLFTGLAGLRAHQTFIDVIGANLANISTPGYRGARVTFSDLLSFTLNPGSGPSGSLGGTNPKQIGLGAAVASIDIDTRQGTFQDTGRSMDVALQGKGFFTSTNGVQTFYSRVGAFGIDNSRFLVDIRTGFRIIGSGGGNITIPVSDTLPASRTNSVTFTGSLPATVLGPLEEILESGSAFLAGMPASKMGTPPAGGTTYDLSGMVPGSILVRVNNGAQQPINFDTSDFSDVAAVTASEIEALFGSITSNLTVTANNATGQLDFNTVMLGSTATLKFDDSPGSTGLLAALGLNTTQSSGSEGPAALSTDLSGMTMRQTAYAAGDQIRVQGTNPDSSPFSATFIYGAGNDGTTMGELITFINALIPPGEATVSLNLATGNLMFTATNKQPANMSLSIGDITNASNPAKNDWPSFTLIQDGTGPDTAVASIDVIDSLGRNHPVEFTFTRSPVDASVWDLSATIDPADGTIGTATVSSIRFNQDGSFNVIGGGNNAFSFNFTGITAAQNVVVNLGSAGLFDGVTMLGSATTVAATDQDGSSSGTLLNLAFNETGDLMGFYSNGQSRVLDTLRISVFPNEAGLLRAGNTLFTESPNSDNPITTTAGSAIAGTIRPGSLENSNVDIAEEFVKLIEAQRGFQANARVITTTDEILAELINIVR